MSTMQQALAALAEIPALRRDLDAQERERIAAARAAGAPWDRIASALGIRSRQGAEQRYARLTEATKQKESQ